jgi:hypothetical protein
MLQLSIESKGYTKSKGICKGTSATHKEIEAKISAWLVLKPDPALMAGTTAIKINKTSQTSAGLQFSSKHHDFIH